MKYTLAIALFISSASAFCPSPTHPGTYAYVTVGIRSAESNMVFDGEVNASPATSAVSTSLQAEHTRQTFLSNLLIGAGVASGLPQSAFAAKYGGFGAGSPEVLDPKDAEVDDAILKSDAVQGAISKIQGYQSTVRDMAQALSADSQVDLKRAIIKDLDFAALRQNLNTYNSAFEEDTQRGTDRLIRNIMQDITELETANTLKEGITRSERRVGIMKGKLAKLDQAFSDVLAFAK